MIEARVFTWFILVKEMDSWVRNEKILIKGRIDGWT